MSDRDKIYPAIFPELEQWPIYRLSEDREAFLKEINQFTLDRLMEKSNEELNDLIAKTIYLERNRIKEEPWKVDPPNEDIFWKKIRKTLVGHSLDKDNAESRSSNEEILKKIINRYSEEIVGNFKIKTFKFARKFLYSFFSRLLNTAAERNHRRLYGSKFHLYDRLKVYGAKEQVRTLFKKGTVVLVPTHFSNLDSILIGYAMDAIVGLPSFSYGAGLNLFNTGYTAYFMNRLGAYRLDRRKKNPIYLETLKAMSNLSIQRGTNSLFFPGGTRSRSGIVENKLKMGLLGTAVEAQRANYEKGTNEKIFIVPLVLSYHFVLEAQFLIEQHLKKTGKELYLKSSDNSSSFWDISKFIWKLFSQSSEIILSLGKPIDVLGNFVDDEGNSIDKRGTKIELKEYFMRYGELKKDLQREEEYTKILADKIVERFHAENIVLSSHLVAFAAFNLLAKQSSNLDLYGILRLPIEDYIFSKESLIPVLEQLQEKLYLLETAEKVKLSKEIRLSAEALLADGIRKLGKFHAKKPLLFNKNKQIVSEDFNVLYYYHNRLDHYNLSAGIQWTKYKLTIKE